jgi:adenylylsulfate kinase
MVIWMIGLSGAGKTALSQVLYGKLKPQIPNLVRLDGDVIRAVFGNDVDHTLDGRRRNAERLSGLSKFLADQGIHVIAAVLSIFPEWRAWNRANMTDYAEVYLKASMETLTRRDTKALYSRAMRGEIPNVVGVDIPFPDPESPELVIENDTETGEFDAMVDRVMRLDVVRRALRQA